MIIFTISAEDGLVHFRERREDEGGLLPLGQLHGLLIGSLPRQNEDGGDTVLRAQGDVGVEAVAKNAGLVAGDARDLLDLLITYLI